MPAIVVFSKCHSESKKSSAACPHMCCPLDSSVIITGAYADLMYFQCIYLISQYKINGMEWQHVNRMSEKRLITQKV